MHRLGGADDRGVDGRLSRQPGQRDLGPADAAALGDGGDGVDDGLVVGAVERLAELVGLAAGRRGVPVAGQPAAGQRAPRDDADAQVGAQRQHLPLLLAVEQVVVVLHRDERRPPVGDRRVLGLGELPGVHRRGADVAGLAGLDDVVQRLHRLLDRRVPVPAVDLVEVDVVGAEAAQAGVDLGHDRLARQAGAVGALVHAAVDLGGEHELVAVGVRRSTPCRRSPRWCRRSTRWRCRRS